MKAEVFITEKIPMPDKPELVQFLQRIANRRMVGHLRYGLDKKFRYMSRLSAELKSYRKTGNAEQLLNIAVYAYLEQQAPENVKFHFDPTADSATRGKF